MKTSNTKKLKQNWPLVAAFSATAAILTAWGIADHLDNTTGEKALEIEAYHQVFSSLDKQYGDNKRITNILKNSHFESQVCVRRFEEHKPFAAWHDDCKKLRENFLQPIADGKIKVSLSSDLPAFSVVQVFKDAVALHANLPQSTQSLALRKTFEYMAEQKQDGLPYGNGETFTIAEGEVSYYKGRRRAPYILIPSS